MNIIRLLYKVLGRFLRKRKLIIAGSLFYYDRKTKLNDEIVLDYIRSATLKLVAAEIKERQLQGSIAELGVFKGEFAAKLNKVFPKHKLYLFDTFEGFDKRDTRTEREKKFSAVNQNFSDTSVELVLSKMTTPVNCIIKKGYFPDTAAGIDDSFIFVSLDADLYEPILAGLQFFYPRLISGGYIFIHDYNNDEYKGARKAVNQFCKAHNISIVPIPDICGTAILTK